MQNLCWHDIQLTQSIQNTPSTPTRGHSRLPVDGGLQGECIT